MKNKVAPSITRSCILETRKRTTNLETEKGFNEKIPDLNVTIRPNHHMRGGECRLSRYHCPGISLFRVPLQGHQLERFLHLNKLFLQDLMPETPLQGSRDEEISLTDGPCHSDAAALVMRQEAGHWWWPNPQGSWGHSQHPMGTARAVPCRGGQDASSCLRTSPAYHSGTLREGWHLTAS